MAKDTFIFESTKSFSVPEEIVDKYLDAPTDSLRLILFLLRHPSSSFTRTDICKATGIEPNSLETSFEYWVERQVLFSTQQKYTLSRPHIKAEDIHPYSAAEVATRIDNDYGVRFLYERTEALIARPLTTSDASTVLSLIDWIGLSAEAAALLLQYCGDTNRKTMRLIQKTAIEWADKGIVNLEAAEKFINDEKEKVAILSEISRTLGISNRALGEEEKKVMLSWHDELGFNEEMIKLAYESMIKSIGGYKYQYIDKILRSWSAEGIKTPEEVEKMTSSHSADKKKNTTKKTGKESENARKTVEATWRIMDKELSEDE